MNKQKSIERCFTNTRLCNLAISSPGKSMLKSKPSGILKKAKPVEDENPKESEKINREKYEEIVFSFDEEVKTPVNLSFGVYLIIISVYLCALLKKSLLS